MFENRDIDKYLFEEVPLDRDCFLMSELYMKEYGEALKKMLHGEDCNPYEVGYVSPVAIRKIYDTSLELSWYANTHTRFHEVSITLPRDKFKICVGCWQYDIPLCQDSCRLGGGRLGPVFWPDEAVSAASSPV